MYGPKKITLRIWGEACTSKNMESEIEDAATDVQANAKHAEQHAELNSKLRKNRQGTETCLRQTY